ncbi:S8 family serine peptidase [Austwickia chelonae]|uniref:S8 family serine peptidase n=1 Tax=Austwickia chelonae TaxID=100225 RepID=UPI0013C2F2F3|nr:S8 family serine peptidase [Austwickia chelonae]
MWCVGVLVVGVACAPVMAAAGTYPTGGVSGAGVVASPVVESKLAEPLSPEEKRRLVRERSWWIPGLGVDRSVQVSSGAGVKVCVIDSGVDATHQDLVGIRFEGGADFSGKGSPDGLKPNTEHGTSMVGYIAGRGSGPGRSQGIIGAAPDATIMSVSSVVGLSTPQNIMAKAISYCVAQGAKVINISQAGGLSLDKARALIEAQEKDVVVVVGAGNSGRTDGGAWREAFGALQVGGVMADLQLDPESNRGVQKREGFVYGQGNALCGPFSVNQKTPIPGVSPSGGYVKSGGGTSGATAVVSGVVAAVRSKYPELSAGQVIRRVLATAKRTSDGAVPDEKCGWGVVDAYAAVTADVPAGSKENPLGKLKYGNGAINRPSHVESMGEWDRSYKPTSNTIEDREAAEAEKAEKARSVELWKKLRVAGGVAVVLAVVGGGIFWWRRRSRSSAQ